jgi:hypothetical protein
MREVELCGVGVVEEEVETGDVGVTVFGMSYPHFFLYAVIQCGC